MKLLYVIILFAVIIFSLGCEEKKETSIRGSLTVYVDETIFPLVKSQVDTFSVLYKEAKIKITPVSAREGIAKIVNNESEIFISSRELNLEEKSVSKKNKLEIKTLEFCYDGIALITAFETYLDNIKYDEIKSLLKGEYPNVTAVMTGRNSGIYDYLQNEIMKSEKFSNVEVLLNEHDVVNFVRQNKNKIGFVGYNILNDSSKVKILNVGLREQTGAKDVYLEPHPGYFVQRMYPLSRLMVIFVNEINLGLASGFASFLTGNEGQRIVLNNKLGPATVPVKLISN